MNRSSSPVRVACYVRCSTSQQAERDESTIETQIAETQRFAREQLACPDPAIYVDEGRTGTSLARPAWERLLADAREDILADPFAEDEVPGALFPDGAGRGTPKSAMAAGL